jgi:sulfur relay (sulfurtransferase) complex TusBCD TusD component (DsrE family)
MLKAMDIPHIVIVSPALSEANNAQESHPMQARFPQCLSYSACNGCALARGVKDEQTATKR